MKHTEKLYNVKVWYKNKFYEGIADRYSKGYKLLSVTEPTEAQVIGRIFEPREVCYRRRIQK